MKKILLLLPLLSLLSYSECTVSLDIGHSPKSGGATSAHGIPEYQFNKELTLQLANKLSGYPGIRVNIINKEGREISLGQRSTTSNSAGTDLFVSIHHDSVKEVFLKRWEYNGKKLWYCDRFSGHGLFVSEKNKKFKESFLAAKMIGGYLKGEGYTPSLHHAMDIKGERRPLYSEELGIYRFDDLLVLKGSKAPAVLIEAGIILNRDDAVKLSSTERQDGFSDAVAGGISDWCEASGFISGP